jgi:uncharacterized protein
MKTTHLSIQEWGKRIGVALLFIVVGFLIIVVFSPWRPLLGRILDYIGRFGLVALLLIAVMWVRRNPRNENIAQLLNSLLILAVAVSLDWIFGIYLIEHLGVSESSPAGWAILKLNEFVILVGVIIFLNKVSGNSLSSLYIQKGNLILGLSIGLVTFFLAAASSFPMASLFKAHDLSIAGVVPWIPWLLLYVLANASLEELMFRGLFLRKLDPFFGKLGANLLIALVFTVLHRGASYTSQEMIFLAVLFPLALAWGYLTQKTGALWAAILFHAGMDIPIMLGIFSNLK